MTEANKGQETEREFLAAWDPLTDTVRTRLRTDIKARADSIMVSPRRWRLWWATTRFRVATQPMSALFFITASLTLVGAILIGAFGWPVWGHASGEYVGVVVAAGSATAFGSIVFSVASTSFSRAADIAPGYTAVVLGRSTPWLGGLGIIAVSGILLTYATQSPTQSGAIAAVLLAVSAVTWSWISVRSSLAKSDPLAIAQDAGRYYRKAMKRTAKYAQAVMAEGLPKTMRANEEAVAMLTRDHQRDLIVGLLRQLRAGVRSTAGQARLTESVMLLEALVNAFDDYATMVNGEIGPHDGLLDVVLTAVDSVIDACIQHEDNEAGNYAIRQLVHLGARGYSDPDYAAVRSLASSRLTTYVDRTWDNDSSSVPAASVTAIGDLVAHWITASAYEDVMRGLETLSKMAMRALLARKVHIGSAATSQLASVFVFLANEEVTTLRDQYLERWSEAVVPIARVAPYEPLFGMYGVADALVPGLSLGGGASLQQAIWSIDPSHALAAADAILSFLEKSISWLRSDEVEQNAVDKGLAEYLAVAYQALLLLVGRRDKVEAVSGAERALEFLLAATSSEAGTAALSSTSVVEAGWSIILASGALGASDERLAEASNTLLDRLGVDNGWDAHPRIDAYEFSFAVGLMVIAGRPEDEISAWEDRILATDDQQGPFGWRWDWGMYIEGLGRSPATNRNRATASQSIFNYVNQSAVDRWPLLGSQGKVPTR